MKAAVYRKFGGPEVVHVEDVPTPVPGPGEVLIRIAASTASMADYRTRTRDLPKGLWLFGPLVLGIFAPRHRILGMDLAGTVESVGSGVTRWTPGDEVIAMPGANYGGHAEYICIKEGGAIASKPAAMTFEEAVTLVFGPGTIAAFFEPAPVKAGDAVLVNGASSATGTAAVQLAKSAGATVTAVTSGRNAGLVRGLGADHVVDYTTTDFAASGARYDVVIDCIGNAPYERIDAILNRGGVFMPVATDLHTMLWAGGKARKAGKRVIPSTVNPTAATLATVVKVAEAGGLKAVIDRTYGLAGIVEAHRYLDTGRKRGNIVIRIP